MDQPNAPKPLRQNLSLLTILVILFLIACVLLSIGIYTILQPQLSGLFPSGTATQPCMESRLFLGSSTYSIRPSPSGTGSAVPAVPTNPGVVYWVGGDLPNYTLVFNPDRQNQVALGTLKAEAPISVTWEDCSAGGYVIEKVEVRETFNPAQVDPKLVGVTLYLPLDETGRSLVATARLVESSAAFANQPTAAEGHVTPTSLASAIPVETAPVTLSTPTCPAPGLALGSSNLNIEGGPASADITFAIQPVTLTPGQPIPELPQTPGVAYLLSSTGERRVFLVGLSAFGPDQARLQGFTQALYTGDDCSSTLYQLSPLLAADLNTPNLLDLLPGDLAILIPGEAGQTGYLLQGSSTGQLIIPPTQGAGTQGEVQIEVGILEVKPSADGFSIQVRLSIYNYGAAAITVTTNDLKLVAAGQAQPPAASQPPLPVEIAPGQTVELVLTFPSPAQGVGVLDVFTLEYDLADFVQ